MTRLSVVRRTVLASILAVACGGPAAKPSRPPTPAAVSIPPLLARVGPTPRAYASVSFAQPWFRQLFAQLLAVRGDIDDLLVRCHIDLAQLQRMRIAVGEPLRVAAELDAAIDKRALGCVAGEQGLAQLAALGITIRERPGGVTIEYQALAAGPAPVGADIAARCATDSCAAARLGPSSRALWVTASFAHAVRIQLEAPGLGAAGSALVAAAAALRPTVPALADLHLEIHGDVLAFELAAVNESLALALREHLLEAFRLPSSSMEPTLHAGDHFFVVKGPLAGAPTPGDVYVYRTHNDRDFVFRFITGGPHTVEESEDGIAIDGKLLPRTVVDAHATYRDEHEDQDEELAGSIVREHAGPRSYTTFRTGPQKPGQWFVPAGSAFFLGDNRNNANDSRFNPLVPLERLLGRAVVIWWAVRDGVPRWDRIGLPIE